ncbi:ABC transporter substrate-binding protein, partial [Stutzerimonas stutzeri]|uniref:ABC transporter substrate-binding protein n=1 Tax=Stutzerimonas stutzeri TaxID=316 RepID=UPI0024B7B273
MTDKPNNDQPSDLTLASRRSFLKHSIIAASGVALFGGMSLGMRSAAWAAGGDVETSKAKLGFIALTDAAPLFVAAEKGFFAEPSTRLSRVVPQEDCLSTSTSVIPYLAKNGIDGAHILTPMPYLISAGIVTPNNQPVPMSILARLNLAGQCISVGEEYRDLKIGLDSTPFKAALEAKKAGG